MNETNRSYIPTLNGWRAAAILMVVLGHAMFPPYCAPQPQPVWCRAVLLGGHGVAVFFGLSGFLITARLLMEREQTGETSLRAFYIRRAFRILPAAFVYLGVITLLGLAGRLPVAPAEVLSSAFFFRNYIPLEIGIDRGSYTAQFWSLAVEEHFYFIWPLLLIAGLRRQRALRYALVLAVAIAGWRYFDSHMKLIEHWFGVPGYQWGARTDTRLDAILWGCIAALIWADPRGRQMLSKLLVPVVWWLLLGVYLLGIALQVPGVLWHTLLVPPLIVGTLMRPEAPVGRLLESGPLRFIGAISYSLYLWHPLFMPQRPAAVVAPDLQRLPWNVLLAFAVACGSYYLVEQPFQRWGRQLARRNAVKKGTPLAIVSPTG